MKFVASQGGPKVPANATVTATVGIGPRSEGGFGLELVETTGEQLGGGPSLAERRDAIASVG